MSSHESEGNSVFDPPSSEPAPTEVIPAATPPGGGGPPTAPPPGDTGDPGDNRRRWAIVLGLVAAILMLALVLLLVNGDGDGDLVATDSSTTSATSTTTTSTTTTTTVPTTTTAVATTTVPAPTPSASTTTVAPTTTSPPAVTVPVAPVIVDKGRVILNAGQPGESERSFGTDGDQLVASLTLLLGPADDDSGWGVADDCFSSEVRRLEWTGLEIVLTEPGAPLFEMWLVDGQPDGSEAYRTPEGVGISTTVQDLVAAYQPDIDLDPVGSGLDEFVFIVDGDDPSLAGLTEGDDPADVVTLMWSGDACQPLFAL